MDAGHMPSSQMETKMKFDSLLMIKDAPRLCRNLFGCPTSEEFEY